MEGRPSFALGHDYSHYSIKIAEHVSRSYPQHREADSLQISLTQGVNARLCAEFMHCTVDLNQNARRKTCEVRNIPTDRVLPSKFHAFWFRSESAPQ